MRFVALLRGINVGGHRVRMDRLRELFGELGLGEVATLIASGNVVFRSSDGESTRLESRIETRLVEGLGYSVPAFVRRADELTTVIDRDPFGFTPTDGDVSSVYVMFLKYPPSESVRRGLASMRSPTDTLHAEGREVYWLCRTRMSDSPVGELLERTVGQPGTIRKMSTLRRIADKLR